MITLKNPFVSVSFQSMITQSHTYVNPSASVAGAQFKAIELNNKGQSLSNQGRYNEALTPFKEALRLKIEAFGSHSVQAALSYNALGECYLNLQQYDLARENLQQALTFRQTQGETLDTRITRDNLGRVCEELGDKEGSRRHRKDGLNLCSHVECFPSKIPQAGKPLKTCARCKAIYYCSPNCQKMDWVRHKKFCGLEWLWWTQFMFAI